MSYRSNFDGSRYVHNVDFRVVICVGGLYNIAIGCLAKDVANGISHVYHVHHVVAICVAILIYLTQL